jgi:glycosyltransferase involved in cell wall biosynthesis
MMRAKAHLPTVQNSKPARNVRVTRPRLKILWLAHLDYHMGNAHGGNLRLFNYGKKLLSAGHDVYFLVRKRESDNPIEKEIYLDGLKQQKIITDYFEIEYDHPRLRGKLGHLLFHPALTNRLLRKQQAPVIDAIRQIITGKQINVCICTSRDLLFALPAIRKEGKTIVDWVDSYFLYHLRDARLHLAEYRPDLALKSLRFLADAFIEERYYSRHSDLNLAVSPIDKRYLDFANGSPRKNFFLLNGVSGQRTNGIPKVKGRLIFTGNMDFPPNYESAIWFIDHVFPLLRDHREVHLVIAGANPTKELRARAGERVEVTGYKEELRQEIARSELYVAPLICGGGFKNKVLEAIASGTYLVGTSMAVEFLGVNARKLFLIADTPRQMADAILTYLQEPQKFADNLEALKRIVDEEFSWERKAKEFVEIICEAEAG